jgi:anti-anti-sigma factor
MAEEPKTGTGDADNIGDDSGAPDLLISTHPHGTALRVEVQGDVDLFSTPGFQETLEALCRGDSEQAGSGLRTILEDLRQVAFIDSAGLAALVHARQKLAAR